MNRAIEEARRLRQDGGTPNPSALHRLAKEDATDILNALQDGVEITDNDLMRLIFGHLTVDELGATVYRHAMIEAGAVIDARTKQAYEVCPYCAYRFPA